MRKFSLILLCFFAFAGIANAQTADDVLKKYFENIGGLENWKKVKALKATGKVNAGGMELPLEMLYTDAGKVRMKFELQGKELIQQAFDGTVAWSTNFQTMKAEKNDNEATENMKRAGNEFPDPFIDYSKKGFKVEMLGKEQAEGVDCFKIKLTKTPVLSEGKEVENVTFYFFDAENYVPILTESEIKSGPMKGKISQTLFSDYKEVSGLYFPFAMTSKLKGTPQGQTINFLTVEVNPVVNESLFTFVESK
jgi:hypothetical protein